MFYANNLPRFLTASKNLSQIYRSIFHAWRQSYSAGTVHDVPYENSLHRRETPLVKTAQTLPASADVVVIGGGSIGCSTAYHLAKFGAGKVVLLEKEKLTAGTTWHTAGIVYNIRDGNALTQMQNQTVQLLSEDLPKEIGFDTGFITTGALYVTRRKAELDALEKKCMIASQLSIKAWMVDKAEISRLHPLLNARKLLGAIYSPLDGTVDPATVCTSYIKGATKYGAEVFEKCDVTGIKTDKTVRGLHKVVAVETSRGTIKTKNIVNCAGCWAPYIAKMVNVVLPQITYKHTYVVTQGIKGIETTPQIRDSDLVIYQKRQGDALLFGGYEKDPEVVRDGKPERDFAFGLYDMNWEQFEVIYNGSVELVPEIAKVGIRSTVCGPESFTPDNRPLIGETPDIKGFYVASGFNSGGMMMGGGAGRQLAHLIIHGAFEYDLQECDVNRFTRKQDYTWLVEACHDSFTTRYDIQSPDRQFLGGRMLRTTALTEDHINSGAYLNSIFGHEVPMYFMPGRKLPLLEYDYFGYYDKTKHEVYPYRDHLYKDASFDLNRDIQQRVTQESIACYDSAGVCDLSHLSEFSLHGSNADNVLSYLLSSDVTSLKSNTMMDSFLLSEQGVAAALVTVNKLADGSYLLTSASEFQDVILRHFNHFLINNNIDCEFCDVTDDTARFRIMGKQSLALLRDLVKRSCEDVAHMQSLECKIGNKNVLVSRSGCNNRPYYDITCKMVDIKNVYDAICGSKVSSIKVGLRSLNSVLLEMGQRSCFSKYWRGLTPKTANLTSLCTLDGDRDYIGKDAVKKMLTQPKTSTLIRFTSDPAVPIFVNDMIWRDDEYIGVVVDSAFGSESGRYHVLGNIKWEDGRHKEFMNGIFTVGSYSRKTQAEIIHDEALINQEL